MIDFIKGQLFDFYEDCIVVENNGMGYRIATSSHSILDFQKTGDTIIVYTEMIVREDAISLVGFSSREELKLFQLLTSVSGVGTKVGIAILSSFHYQTLPNLIANKDLKALTSAHGVGKKTAERIVLELKDKLGAFSTGDATEDHQGTYLNLGDITSDVLSALSSLGYTRLEAERAIKGIPTEGETVEGVLKVALRRLMTE